MGTIPIASVHADLVNRYNDPKKRKTLSEKLKKLRKKDGMFCIKITVGKSKPMMHCVNYKSQEDANAAAITLSSKDIKTEVIPMELPGKQKGKKREKEVEEEVEAEEEESEVKKSKESSQEDEEN